MPVRMPLPDGDENSSSNTYSSTPSYVNMNICWVENKTNSNFTLQCCALTAFTSMTGVALARRGVARVSASCYRRAPSASAVDAASSSSKHGVTPLPAADSSGCRPFFNVPNLDDLCAKTFSSTKRVHHSPKKLFAVVADVDRYEEFVPFCARSRVVRRHDDAHFEAELEIGFKLFNERYLSSVTLVEDESVTAEAIRDAEGKGSSLFERLVSTWEFAPGATPDECVVSFDIDFRVASVMHAQAVGLFFEEVSRMQINAFEERCDALYGRPKRREIIAPNAGTASSDDEAFAETATARSLAEATPPREEWETHVLAEFALVAKRSVGQATQEESAGARGDTGGNGGSEGLGLRDFSAACTALARHGVQPFAAVSSRPLLCGALHVALDTAGAGRVTLAQAVAAARLSRQEGLESGMREADAGELEGYLMDQLRSLKRRMPHVVRLASQQQYAQSPGSAGTGSSGERGGEDGSGIKSGGSEGECSKDSGFDILMETAMADVMVDAALEGADQLARELFEALDVDRSGMVTGEEWADAVAGHPGLLSPHTLDGILRLGVLFRQARGSNGGDV